MLSSADLGLSLLRMITYSPSLYFPIPNPVNLSATCRDMWTLWLIDFWHSALDCLFTAFCVLHFIISIKYKLCMSFHLEAVTHFFCFLLWFSDFDLQPYLKSGVMFWLTFGFVKLFFPELEAITLLHQKCGSTKIQQIKQKNKQALKKEC